MALHTWTLFKCFVCGTVGRLNSIGHSLCLCELSVGGLGERQTETVSALLVVGADVSRHHHALTLKGSKQGHVVVHRLMIRSTDGDR